MVKIAIAGSSGEVAQEVIEALIATGRHELFLLSRKDPANPSDQRNMTFLKVNYAVKEQLKEALRGVHPVLSFITPQTDQNNEAQKNLINAAISVGVKRFAPSEWATSSFEHMPWYSGKAYIREYLEFVNKEEKVLEYSLFQPGLFTNYLTHPHKSAKHINTFQTQFDYQNRRAIVAESFENDMITLTTAQDLAVIVVKAVDYDGEWPVNGGIRGSEISVAALIRMGEKIRGGKFTVDVLKVDDLRAGTIKSTWMPRVDHPAIPSDQAEQLEGMLLAGMALGIHAGALTVSDEWNRIFPDYQFTQPAEFLAVAWSGQP